MDDFVESPDPGEGLGRFLPLPGVVAGIIRLSRGVLEGRKLARFPVGLLLLPLPPSRAGVSRTPTARLKFLASAGVRASLRRGAGESAIARSSRSVGAARGAVAETAGLA